MTTPHAAKLVPILLILTVGTAGVEAFGPPPPTVPLIIHDITNCEVVEVLDFDNAKFRQACTYVELSGSWGS